MTKKEIETQFTQLTPMLHQLAHICAGRCGRPEEEAFGEACYWFAKAANTWNKRRGVRFITYCYVVVHRGLIMWGRKMDLPPDPENAPERVTTLTPAWHAHFNDWLEHLSDECREVARLILDGPAEVLGLVGGETYIAANAIKSHLRRQGWDYPRIWNTMRELKAAVRAL